MLRTILTGAALLTVTVVLIPLQWLAVVLGLSIRRRIPVLYHRTVCALLGVRTMVLGSLSNQRPLLVVANHVSWLDVSVIAAVAPVVFIAKQEVAGWPLIGVLARLQRSIFVERRRRIWTAEVNARIARRLVEGDAIVLFGEGTSSDGNRVLPFYSALLGAAGAALTAAERVGHVAIQPVSVSYVGLDGLPMGRRDRPVAAWYGDMKLLPHLVGVISRGALDALVTCGQPIRYDAHSDRKAIAKELENRVRRMTIAALRGTAAPRQRAAEERVEAPSRALPGHSFSPQNALEGNSKGAVPATRKAEAR
jgi:lyso-ornithine lipid O-acyltransferase